MTQPPFPPPPPPPRRLHRRTDDRVLAGVASGIADYLGADPVWIRIAFVASVFLGGIGLLIYIAGWIAMPAADFRTLGPVPPRRPGVAPDARLVVGVVLLIIAALVLAASLGIDQWGLVWGSVLVAIGVLLLIESRWPSHALDHVSAAAAAWPGAPPVPPAAPAPPPDQSYSTTPSAGLPVSERWEAASPYAGHPSADAPGAAEPLGGSAAPELGELPADAAAPGFDAGPPPAPGFAQMPGPAAPGYFQPLPAARPTSFEPGPARTSRRFPIGMVTTAVVLLALGVAALLDNLGLVSVSVAAGFGLVLVVVGAGLVVGTWAGRSWWLIALGLVLLPFAAASSLIHQPISGGTGDLHYTPRSVSAIQPAYHLIAGQLTVDLSQVEIGTTDVHVDVTDAMGQVVIILPPDAAADISASAGAGELQVLGHTASGYQVSNTVDSPGAQTSSGTFNIDVSVGMGQVTVERGPYAAASGPSVVEA